MVDRSETFVKGRGEKNFRPPPFSRGGGYGTLTPGDYIMIRIQNIPLPIGGDLELLRRRAGKALGVRPGAIEDLVLVRQSIDARKKQDVHYVYTVDVSLKSGEEQAVERAGKKNIALVTPKPYVFPEVKRRSGTMPVVVGMGPAGLFAALFLARNGIPCVVLERGEDVDARTAKVEGFWAGGALDPASNVQFGEGGAGTFSDGKLTTGTHDPRISAVMDALVGAGAPADVKWSHKPHIGTDILRQVVKRIRQELIALGCDVRFGHQLTGLETGEGMLTGVRVEGPQGAYRLDCGALVLAPGHSARDTFAMLHGAGVPMEQKPFAIGVRIEQDQAAVSRAQYGPSWEQLPPSDYKLACHLPTGRSAFTFCVCPGGEVVAAASAPGQVVTNGMSYRARDGKNINGGFLVGVGPEDFSAFGSDPLAGVRFQEQWEHAAFQLGGGNFYAPAQRVEDFLLKQPSQGPGSIRPTYRPGVTWTELDRCLPRAVADTLRGALPLMDRKLRGFACPDGVLTGVETRSSSPVRILRDETLQSALRGLYPCGEGAGYAGGRGGIRVSPRDDRPLRRGPAAGGARGSAYKRFCGAKTLAETRLCRVEHFNRQGAPSGLFANRWGQGPGMPVGLSVPRWMVSGWPRPSPRDDRPLRRGPAAGGARGSAYKRFCGAKTLAETRLCRVEHFNRPRGSQRFACKPLGTGAGYAGGIVSAAVDGIRVAEAIAKG